MKKLQNISGNWIQFCLFSVIDNELHDHFLRDKNCERISRGEQSGSGILSYRALGKLQIMVSNLLQEGHRQSFNSKYKVKQVLSEMKRVWMIV